MLRYFKYFGGLLLPLILCGGVPVRAQVGLSPMVVETQAEQGKTQGVITVSNSSNQPFRARVYTVPFTYHRDHGFQVLDNSSHDLSPYLRFAPRELVVPAGASRRIRYVVQFPPSLPDGEYRTTILTENLDQQKQISGDGNQFVIALRLATTVYARKGKVAPTLAVDSASTNEDRTQVNVLVRNSGQATARPMVNWKLQQGKTTVKEGALSTRTVVASTERNLPLFELSRTESEAKPKALLPGQYQLTGNLVWGPKERQEKQPFSINFVIP